MTLSYKQTPIKSFLGPGCEGNAHQVVEVQAFDSEGLKALSWELGPTILVALKVGTLNNQKALDVGFYHNGHKVSFCGSGLLAAMHHIEKYYLQKHPSIDPIGDNERIVKINNRPVRLGKHSGRYSLTATVDLQGDKKPASLLKEIIDLDIIELLELPSGYLIAEISCPSQLKLLRPNLERLKQQGGPSLIVTAAGQDVISEDYAMRYFAPQYGNPEDPATGSANLFLMKYWQEKLHKSNLVGRQLSAEGGLFFGSVQGDQVTLSGVTK